MSLSSLTSKSLTGALGCWRQAMNSMSQSDSFPSAILFKSADNYYPSPECQNHIDPVPKGLYLRAVIKPLYHFIRDQGYDPVDGKFRYRSGPHKRDKTRLVDIPPAQGFMYFDRIDFLRAFFRAYYDKRSFGHFPSPCFDSTLPITPRPSTSQTDDIRLL
ncbi:hypothetical protein EDB84DRAFT_1570435 [Lactarius hengduanensis]|nr:hypothetical protein EDB84DRAFT_1570435 [Lactarius hengduanensis]